VIAGGRPADFADADAIARLAERFNAAAELAKGRGMEVGYHNHWWEFDHDVDGEVPYDRMLSLVDPSVFVEVDIYWVQVGGKDPAAVVSALGPRARFLHVKDGPLEPKTPMTAAGDGAVDLPAVLAAGVHAEWHVVELDECGTDMFEAVEKSHRYLVGAGLSSGR
jgi:sugar phosphate isomerase/epimerase